MIDTMGKGKSDKFVEALGVLISILGCCVGCSLSGRLYERNIQCEETITMAGSTSMEKLADALAESFMTEHPYVTVTAEFTGSSAGIEAVLTGSADIGISSRSLKEEEKALGAVENIVAVEGIAIIVDMSNTVSALTVEQLTDIYTGGIRNWSELGGTDEAIVVIGREAGSGTREVFEGLLGVEYMCAYANELDSTGAVLARTASTPGAIGYVSRDVANNMVQVLAINGFEPSDSNISKGSYPLSRPLFMITKGAVSARKKAVQELFTYLHSEDGEGLIESVGLIVPKPYKPIRQYTEK
ncbi:MAG: phosphate ABC transporter substrate-binding protein [Lachnospiraceae bacterium]|nr:phosphate ABC transporter substrate-binding protein [Lachnospiraceae bacterium]